MLTLHTARQAPPLFMCGEFAYDSTSSRFEFVFKSVNDGAAQGTSTYTVAKGDTLQSIAKAQLGDADLWFTIAQANGLADSADLQEGQVLRIPAVVVTSTNNDDGTFEAYDPSAIIGDSTPVIPQPPKKKQNWLKQIVIVVAAVVVAYFTQQWYLVNYGTAATATTATGVTLTGSAASTAVAAGTATATSFTAGSMIAAGAVAGAVGSVASQLTGMALGEQDKFSWKQVGLGAIGGGITGGLSQVNALSNSTLGAFGGGAARGFISSAVTQGIGVATGLQEKFSWTAVAASALSAGVAERVGEAIGGANWQSTQRGGDYFKTSLISNAAGSITRGAVMARGGKIEWGQVAADTFGQTIGNSLVQGHRLDSQQAARAAQVQQAQALADNRTALNAVNQVSDANYYAPSYSHWPDQTGAESARLAGLNAVIQASEASHSPEDSRSLLNAVERGINPGAYTSVAGRTVRASNNGLGISSLIGTSNPQAVGNFMRANGMTSDNLQGGRNYFIPDSTTAYGNNTALGQYGLNLGNARAAAAAQLAQVSNASEVQRLVNRSAASQAQGGVAAGVVPAYNNGDQIRGITPGFWERIYGSPEVQKTMNNTITGQFVVKPLLSLMGQGGAVIRDDRYDFAQLRELNPVEAQRAKENLVINVGTLFIPGGAAVSAAARGEQAAIRERVLANIADSQSARASSNFGQFIKNEGQLQAQLGIWPPNSGGFAPTYGTILDVGMQLDRFGYPGGAYLSPLGASFESRALPPSYLDTKPYFQYEVVQPITGVTEAKALPWFGQPGRGTQFQLPNPVQYYLENGSLKVIQQ